MSRLPENINVQYTPRFTPLSIHPGKRAGDLPTVTYPDNPVGAAKDTTGLVDINTANQVVVRVADVRSAPSDNQPNAIVSHFWEASNRMHALAPADGIEGMTAALLVAVQDAALVALRDSTHADRYDHRASSAGRADRLLSAFVKLGDFRARLRGGGTLQRVTVEHVTVAAGGQAVIGAIAGAGGGAKAHSGDEPHATA